MKRLPFAFLPALAVCVLVVQLKLYILIGAAALVALYPLKLLLEVVFGSPFTLIAERSEGPLQLIVLVIIVLMVLSIVSLCIIYLGPRSLAIRLTMIASLVGFAIFWGYRRIRTPAG
jgi:hypothetical protein